jgi:hypothetical protein
LILNIVEVYAEVATLLLDIILGTEGCADDFLNVHKQLDVGKTPVLIGSKILHTKPVQQNFLNKEYIVSVHNRCVVLLGILAVLQTLNRKFIDCALIWQMLTHDWIVLTWEVQQNLRQVVCE